MKEEQLYQIERIVLLRNVDGHWVNHIDAMEDLEDGIGLQAYAQKDPLALYTTEAADMFDEMIDSVREQTAKMLLMVMPTTQIKASSAPKETSAGLKNGPQKRVSVDLGKSVYGNSAKPEARKEPIRKTAAEKVGRNDPCPCGSGKKYKKCCGAGMPSVDGE